ncbi:CPXCG motif-containing cysteine-rich protein [Marinospirillum alkaliphilum]|uniref:Cysteine-rich CPXCG n=1 Tax=Marinospirillum alkaliphilum DSM 21637 TaxID=1122209 RepID=A0A1K1Z936_9GAMM|nr:CPXCG motif-containing cysteine-rich protein [Marinospirillum alkaliphilum]SFX70227.1 Cysteine-rich CPXCG [Marinospirillum alkaliphilum DSM 21637]
MNEEMLWTHHDHCPYCGSPLQLAIDTSAGSHECVEDCDTCCAPINVEVSIDHSGEVSSVYLRREND